MGTFFLDIFVISVVRYLFVHWLAEEVRLYILLPIGRWLKPHLIKTEHQMALFIHYRNKGAKTTTPKDDYIDSVTL